MFLSSKMNEMERKDKFHFLMDIIEKNITDESKRDPNTGTFSFLQDNLYMRHIPITPSKSVRPEQLKTFLALQVLHIYPVNNNSKITYRTIQKYLDGESNQSYVYQFELLDECFDVEKNREAVAQNSFLINKEFDDVEQKVRSDVWIPYILVQQIEKTAAQKLLEYWNLCDRNWKMKMPSLKEGEDKENQNEEAKEIVYRELLMAIALQEIFERECFFEYAMRSIEAGNQNLEVLKGTTTRFDNDCQRVKGGEKSAEDALKEDIYQLNADLDKISEDIDIINTFLMLFLEHIVGLYAHVELVMMLENINIQSESGKRMKKYYENLHGKNMNYPFFRNKNKSKYYKQMQEFVENALIRYIVQSGCGDYHKAVVDYFKLIAQKGNKYSKKMWETKCTIARPLFQSEGENTGEK